MNPISKSERTNGDAGSAGFLSEIPVPAMLAEVLELRRSVPSIQVDLKGFASDRVEWNVWNGGKLLSSGKSGCTVV